MSSYVWRLRPQKERGEKGEGERGGKKMKEEREIREGGRSVSRVKEREREREGESQSACASALSSPVCARCQYYTTNTLK